MGILIVNFGGPRSLEEISPFLQELLTDPDVIRTPLPRFIERPFFRRIAKKRAVRISHDYELIGGKSPIHDDTEAIAREVRKLSGLPVIVFHRYLTATHNSFLKEIESFIGKELKVFPLYPQFSYATTGSIARWFSNHLSKEKQAMLKWIPSYPTHPSFISPFSKTIQDSLEVEGWKEEEIILFFSAHGVPRKFIDEGDPYQDQCNQTFLALSSCFPNAISILAYQSKFGRGEWLRPYTIDMCAQLPGLASGRKKVIVVPLSFTSDHIETLFEIEYQYLPIIREQGLEVKRCPALNLRIDWIEGIMEMIRGELPLSANNSLCRS